MGAISSGVTEDAPQKEPINLKLTSLTLAAIMALPVLSCAQEQTSPKDRIMARREKTPDDNKKKEGSPSVEQDGPDNTTRRLEFVRWNPLTHQLTWDVSKGKKDGAAFKTVTTDHYEIDMDDAIMSVSGERRRFSEEEAANVHMLMNLIAKYAIDSTVWWNDGQGEPIDGNGKPTHPERQRKLKRKQTNDSIAVARKLPEDSGVDTLSAEELQSRIELLESRLVALKQRQRSVE
jgi:hypothetical protein